jgi:hypothetical protein
LGCFVETERKHGVNAGMRFTRTARVDVRRREGRVKEAMVIWENRCKMQDPGGIVFGEVDLFK